MFTILLIIVVLMFLGYGGHLYNPGMYGGSPIVGNGMGGIGLILFVILLVLIVRGGL